MTKEWKIDHQSHMAPCSSLNVPLSGAVTHKTLPKSSHTPVENVCKISVQHIVGKK